MKILLILLGCLAFANAAYYNPYYHPYYSYDHYGPRMPSKSCFYFKVYSCPAWFSCGYYRDIIKVYPDDACTLVADETTLVTDADKALEDKRNAIKDELDAKKKTFEEVTLPAKTKCFRDSAKTYWERCYAKRIECAETEEEKTKLESERDGKIKDYNDDLDKMEEDAVKRYQECIDDIIKKLESFHVDLSKQFKDCLDTRTNKIADYEKCLDERAADYKLKFKTAMEDNRKAREEAFKKVLLKCVDDEALADGVIAHYCDDPTVADKITEYDGKIDKNVEDLKKWYKCNYRCYATCSYFNKRSYYCYSRQLGCWWSYKSTYTIPCVRTVKYTYKWTPCEYQCLKTCDPATLHRSKEDVLKDMTDKITTSYDQCLIDIGKFFEQWKTIHTSYVEKYEKIIADRHTCEIDQKTSYYKYNNGDGVIDADEQTKLDDLKKELDAKKEKLVEEYDLKLKGLRDDGKKDAEEKLDDWKKCAEDYANKLADKYADCLTSIGTKKEDYEKKLDDYIADRRKCLSDNLDRVKDKNVESATCMIRAWVGDAKMGEAGVTAFLGKLGENIKTDHDKILADFDEHWKTTKEKLLLDYECRLICREPQFCFRKYVFPRCYASWRVHYPTVYCYPYRCSYYVKHYYHHNVYGHYWC